MTDIQNTIAKLTELMDRNTQLQDYLQKRQNELLVLSDNKTANPNVNWELVDKLDSSLQKAIDDGAELRRILDAILDNHPSAS